MEISSNELAMQIEKSDIKIIDIRTTEAYNGWKLWGEKRGGHIKGAKSLPLKWINFTNWIEIVQHKDINPDDAIIIYGYSLDEAKQVSNLFYEWGYENIKLYKHFVDEWTCNPNLPMEKLARYRHLVSADWAKQLISGKKPDEYNSDKFLVIHTHYNNRDAYLSGHIRGAIDMNTLALESPETWNRRTPEEMKNALEKHGITSDTTVVLYGKFMSSDNADEYPGSPADLTAAIRNAMIMLYAGVKDIRILDGGFQSWHDAGYQIDTTDVPKVTINEFGLSIPQKPELIMDMPQAKQILKAADAELVCIRSYKEYTGEVSGYDYIKSKGRIPGVVFSESGSDAYHMENYRNFDGSIREFREVAIMWQNLDITPDKHLAFYCGTGWRASEAWFSAWLMG